MNKIKIHKYKCLDIILIVVLALVSETQFWFHDIGQKAVFMTVSIYGLYKYNILRKKRVEKQIYRILIYAALPFIFAFIYTFFSVNFENQYNLDIIPQAFTSTGFAFVQMLFVAALISRYKERAIDVVYYYIVISYLITIITSLMKASIGELLGQHYAIENLLERHDIGVAVVSLILYYLFEYWIEKNRNSNYFYRIIILLAIFWLCGKRSAIVALGMGLVIFIFIASKFKYKVKLCICISLIMIVGLYLYVVVIHTGILEGICNYLGISSTGRLYVWNWFRNQYDISPLYLGKGFQYIHKYMMANIAEGGSEISLVSMFQYLHNSDLQIYIELGFIGFFLWFFFYLIIFPRRIRQKFGNNPYYMCIIMMFSMVIMYMTDNTLTYPIYQTTTYIAIGVCCYKSYNMNIDN